jgi:hypothetical protein
VGGREEIRFLAQDVILEQLDDPQRLRPKDLTRQQILEMAVVVFEMRDVLGVDPFGNQGGEHPELLAASVRPERACPVRDELGRLDALLVRTAEPCGQYEEAFVIGRQGSDLGLGAAAAVVTHVMSKLAALTWASSVPAIHGGPTACPTRARSLFNRWDPSQPGCGCQ